MNAELALAPETQISRARAQSIGRRALWHAAVFKPELGVNDPLTHLEQYLEKGEDALDSIDEDLITDIAERKLKPTFVNSVIFDRAGSDFISRQNKFSMRGMTAITESKFSSDNIADIEQYQRAKIEAKEVERLDAWFSGAQKNDVFIAESMPLGSERYSIVRIYEKTGGKELAEHVITLHNATVGIFNQLRARLGANLPDSQTVLDLLESSYQLSPGKSGFAEEYIAAYDRILSERFGQKFRFGLTEKDQPKQDDVTAIRRQTALRSVYLNTIKALGESGGWVTHEIARLNRELGASRELLLDTPIPKAAASELLDRSLQSVAATFNRASKEQLDFLSAGDVSSALASAGHYGGEARAEGIRYDGACPSGPGLAQAEAAALARAHKLNQDPSRCGLCPNCQKQYFVEETVYKARILECDNCHAAIRFGGGSISKKELAELRGQSRKSQLGFFEVIFLSFQKIGLEAKIHDLQSKQGAGLSEPEKRRGAQLLEEYNNQLEDLKYLTS